jgi:hypothetical protein
MGEEDEEFTILIIYVDDGIIFSNKKHILNDILDHLKTVFQIRTLPADRFIGVDITRNRPERSIYLSQPEYIQKITEKFNMTECNQLAIPADPSCRLSPDMSPQYAVGTTYICYFTNLISTGYGPRVRKLFLK